MRVLDRAVILFLNLCLFLGGILAPALLIARTPAYYRYEFQKNGIYSRIDEDGTEWRRRVYYVGGDYRQSALFSDEQLDTIIDHIVTFLFEGGDSFALTMDGVLLNGEMTDGVAVFGEAAVTHMADVRDLMTLGRVATVVAAISAPLCLIYLLWRRRECGGAALRYTAVFYGALLLAAGAFCLWTLLSGGDFLSAFWHNAHHLFFPFQPDKVEGSFFNDTLTYVLTIDLFLDATAIVLLTVVALLAAWLTVAVLLRRRAK